MRLFWIPAGADPADGAYVHYPFDDLLGILALESQRHRCMVIGEDLGTVPEDLRGALATRPACSRTACSISSAITRANSSRLRTYPAQALVAASTHDLPTLAGWWEGRDIALRDELGLFPSDGHPGPSSSLRASRIAPGCLRALRTRRLCCRRGLASTPTRSPTMTAELALAVQAFLARTPSQVLVVQLEDVIGVREQANLPATIDAHPNWRRKLPLPLEQWPQTRASTTLAAALLLTRGGDRPRRSGVPVRRAFPARRIACSSTATSRSPTRRELVPYLAALGVSHVYCSPYLRARAGSLHGYDIVDHGALNPEIGTREDFERFVATLAARGMGHIADVVPNHMAVMGTDNAWWMDVLENGPSSEYADYFDIDWHPLDTDHRPARCWCRCWASTTAACSSAASWSSATSRRRARSRFSITSIACPSIRERTRGCSRPCTTRRMEPCPKRSPGSSPRSRSRSDVSRPRPPAPSKSRNAARTPSSASRGWPFSRANRLRSRTASTRCWRDSMGRRIARIPTLRSTSCSRHRRIASLTGASLPTRSTIAASSTSTSSPRCAWRRRPCSRRRTDSCSTSRREGKVDGFRIDHPDGLVRSGRLFPRLQHRLAERRRETRRNSRRRSRLSTSSSKRSMRLTSSCP